MKTQRTMAKKKRNTSNVSRYVEVQILYIAQFVSEMVSKNNGLQLFFNNNCETTQVEDRKGEKCLKFPVC